VNTVHIVSFGYLHGPPPEADLTADLRRYLYDPAAARAGAMLNLNGLHAEVSEFVLRSPAAQTTVRLIVEFAQAAGAGCTIAVGCAGGRHRSVAIAEAAAAALLASGITVAVDHRHVERDRLPLTPREGNQPC
jgi:UPF0042 nucleotide-binding protein